MSRIIYTLFLDTLFLDVFFSYILFLDTLFSNTLFSDTHFSDTHFSDTLFSDTLLKDIHIFDIHFSYLLFLERKNLDTQILYCNEHTVFSQTDVVLTDQSAYRKKELDSLQKYFVELILCDTVYVIHFFFKRSNKRVKQSKVV